MSRENNRLVVKKLKPTAYPKRFRNCSGNCSHKIGNSELVSNASKNPVDTLPSWYSGCCVTAKANVDKMLCI